MGQYFKIVNVDKKEFLHPHAFGDGLKLLEFGASGGSTMLGLAVLLATSNGRGGGDLLPEDYPKYDPKTNKLHKSRAHLKQEKIIAKVAGRWAGDRIAVVGDYSDKENPKEFAEAYKGEEAGYTDISEMVIEALCCDAYVRKGFAENDFYQRITDLRKQEKQQAGSAR
jgi:dsRNA-specific ribonuclease